MDRFFGRYAHSLDPKGRLILPAKFRPAFSGGGFLTQFEDGCLALWTPARFEERMAELALTQATGRHQRHRARLFAAGTQEVEVDRQGRVPIAQHLRDYAALDGDVLVTGAVDRVELWNPRRWAERTGPTEAALRDDTEEEVLSGRTTQEDG